MPASVLIVEDSKALALTYQAFLDGQGYDTSLAPTAADAQAALTAQHFDAMLLDLHLPDRDGIAFLKNIREQGITVPVIVVTAETSTDMAVLAVKAGAADFISKPVLQNRLLLTLRNTLEKQSLHSIVAALTTGDRDRFCDFIGQSPAMQLVYRTLESASKSRAPVFITGESGTGKELAARAVHQLGDRKDKTFEALNCAAIPAQLIESEMFGHVKGAFTGALTASPGAAARAHQGTLFLDEIAEMPLELQSKLLRFTQTGAFRPVGAQSEAAADTRFISATNRPPLGAVQDGKLREDLYYRLGVIPVHLPPLRARDGDALLIAHSLLPRIAAEEGKPFQGLSPGATDYISSHAWPGNVRQLENTLRRAVVLHDGDTLQADMLSDFDALPVPVPPRPTAGVAPVATLKDIERAAIEDAIARCNGNILQAARILKINPSTIHRKLGQWKDRAP